MKVSLKILFFGALMLVSCKPKLLDVPEYLNWINDTGNGLVVYKSINDIQIKALYLSPEYRLYLEGNKGKGISAQTRDSLLLNFKNQIAFLVKIAPSKSNGGDIMLKNILNYPEYKSRMENMNFHFQEFFELKAGKSAIKPLAYSFENTYGLTTYRNAILVFSKNQFADLTELTNYKWLDLIYYDEIFKTGISHFVFDTEVINDIPKLNI
jgi:hypothetical protein